MVSGSQIEGGNGTHKLSSGVRKTIQSIKEIVVNHSDADIYVTLKETNMDPNETAQKLLNQDPFHEVKRKKDKKKEVTPFKFYVPIQLRKPTEQLVQGMKSKTYSDRYPRRAGYVRNNVSDAEVTREFRAVRDNRMNRNENINIKPSAESSVVVSTNDPLTSIAPEKSSADASKNLKSSRNFPINSLSKQAKGIRSSGKRPLVSPDVAPPLQATKTHDSQQSSVLGFCSSSDPVHIPSLASRPLANVGAIKREVGVRRHTSESSAKLASVQQTKEHFRSFSAVFKSDRPSRPNVPELVTSRSSGRFVNNQYRNRPRQQHVTHRKVPQANKEWKPKSSQKPVSSPANNSKDLATETAQLQAKLPRTPTHEDQNVIIAAHIRVSETDRCRLTFGSLGIEAKHLEELQNEPLASLSVNSSDSSGDEPFGGIQVELADEHVQGSGSVSPESGTTFESQVSDRLESSSPQNMDDYTDIGLVRHRSPSYVSAESQQLQGPSELPSFSQAYDPHTGYDISYFRPATDESLRGPMLQIPQEAFNSHVANSIPAITTPMAQMYPQLHLPHFTNHMPYHRQLISPVYVPPMVMSGYSNNPTYSPHPSNGSTYLMMPKYGIPQYKSIQAGSPIGYTLNTPGVVGSALGIDDSSRLKYKDGNVYVPNPQTGTSEVWMNQRDISPSLQSSSYYNMAAGQTPHAASFNAQSSYMQFPGMMYQSPPNTHHMGPTIAPGTQIGGYQHHHQPQLSQLNWTGNF